MLMENFISGGKVETHPNHQCRTFHMRHELMPHGCWYSSDSISSSEWKDAHPYLTQATVNAIQAIIGVKNVSVSPHEIRIVKSEAFSWEELYPKIKLSMAKYLPSRYT